MGIHSFVVVFTCTHLNMLYMIHTDTSTILAPSFIFPTFPDNFKGEANLDGSLLQVLVYPHPKTKPEVGVGLNKAPPEPREGWKARETCFLFFVSLQNTISQKERIFDTSSHHVSLGIEDVGWELLVFGKSASQYE